MFLLSGHCITAFTEIFFGGGVLTSGKKISLLELQSFGALEIRRLAYFGYLQVKIVYYSEINREKTWK